MQSMSCKKKRERSIESEHGPMQDLFFAGGYELKKDSPRSRLQVSSSVLYKHWKSGKEPKIYRKLMNTHQGLNAVLLFNAFRAI